MDFIAELRRSSFRVIQPDGENVRIGPCPQCGANHALSVNIYGAKVPPGTYKCWSCGWSGNWNKLARLYNLKKIDKDQLTDEANRLLRKQEGTTFSKKSREPQQFEMKPWTGKWRGIPESLLLALGAKLWLDTYVQKDKPVLLTERLYLPVIHDNEEIAYIAAIRHKRDRIRNGKVRTDKYLNKSGEWAKHTLWPENFIVTPAPIIVIVEGPYDCLKLLMYGIPALCFLGVQNWREEKSSVLGALGAEIVIPLTDNDEPGRTCRKRIIKDLEDQFDVREFPYSSHDPGDMEEEEILLLGKIIRKWEKELLKASK